MRRKNLVKANALVGLVLTMLIIMTPFSSALLDWEEEEQEAQTGESIIVNVKGYEPQILPSSVVEDGDVPIYVYLTGLTPGKLIGSQSNVEPIYGSMDIKQVYIRPEDEETLEYVRGSPKYIKPRQVSMDNLGYLIVTLKQIQKEADVPDEIKLNMKAEITFENAERLYSMIEQDLLLPEKSDEGAWRQDPNFEQYQFFAGRGAIRASSISDGSAELTVYGGQDLQWPFTGTPRPLKDLELDKGETSDPIRMSAASDFMTNAFRIKLTDIVDSAKKRARIRVNVNGEEKEYIVTEGSRLYPGSSLTVTEINVVREPRTNRVTYEIVVKGPRDTSRVSKTFFESIVEGAAGILGIADDSVEGSASATAGYPGQGTPLSQEEISAENAKCQTCGGGTFDINTCDKSECHGLGSCYYKESAVGIPGQIPYAGDYEIRTYNDQCYGCAKATRCSDFNDDRDMCNAPACTGRANLNCEWKDNTCKTKAAAQQAGTSSGSVSAGSSTAISGSAVDFVVMSDMHVPSLPDTRKKAVAAVKQINPNFVVFTGDMVSGESTTRSSPEVGRLWDQFGSEVRNELAGIPLVPVAGNHDMASAELRSAFTQYWNSRKPFSNIEGNYPIQYSFDFENSHFVVLKSYNSGNMPDSELEWLVNDLAEAKSEGRDTVVFSHYSLTSLPKGSGMSDVIKPNSRIKSILKEGGIDTFIHGDTHVYYKGVSDGINVISAGALGIKWFNIPGTSTTTPKMFLVGSTAGGSLSSYALTGPDFTTRFDDSIFAGTRVAGFSTAESSARTNCGPGNQGTCNAGNSCPSGKIPLGTLYDPDCGTNAKCCKLPTCGPGNQWTCNAGNSCPAGKIPGGTLYDPDCGTNAKCCKPETCGPSNEWTCNSGNTCPAGETAAGALYDPDCGTNAKCCKPETCGPSNEWTCNSGNTCPIGKVAVGALYDPDCGINAKCCKPRETCGPDNQWTCNSGNTCPAAETAVGALYDTDCGTNAKCCKPRETCGPSSEWMCNYGNSCLRGETAVGALYDTDCGTNAKCCKPEDTCGPEGLWTCNRGDSCPAGKVAVGALYDPNCGINAKCCKPETSPAETSAGETSTPAPTRTTTPTIAAGAGEGVCKNKVVVFREGDTPEQWLAMIKDSTQEMIYCTAAEEFKRVAELYFGIKDDKGILYEDWANYKLGEIYYWLGDTETALKYFRLAIKNNVGEFIPKAKSRITQLEEDAKWHTRYKIGEFEDNGVSIRVMVVDMPFQNEDQPSATIEVEGESTKKLKKGNSLFSIDATEIGEDNIERQYNWIVRDISSESVIVEQKYREAPPRGYRTRVKALSINNDVRMDYGSSYKNVRLKSVDLKKYAIVTVMPGTGAPLVSSTNFSIHIPIEKRAIEWTPDEISDKINSTQAAIKDLDEVITTLNDIVVVWKKVCLVTFGYLTIKNSFFSGMARTQARRLAMHGPDGNSGWDSYCRQNSGEGRMYEDYNECVIDNSDQIESTIDSSQDAIESVNDEMEDYRSQPWYRNLTSQYTGLREYENYMGGDLYSAEQLRDYRYWQLMRQSSGYSSLNGEPSGEGYEYNLRGEVDSQLSSMRLENTEKLEAYLGAVSDVDAHYGNFDTLSEQDKATLFSDLYESHLAKPDLKSGDFPLIEMVADPLATIRREGRQLYSNTPHGRITIKEATVSDYQIWLADATSTGNPRYLEGMNEEIKERFTAESVRVESAYEGNPYAPLRTNQGSVYIDEEGTFYVAMTTAYSTGETNPGYNPQASAEFYPDGKPYCIPTCNGNYVKVLDFYQDGSPSVIQQWNVGTDGFLCTEDDVLVMHHSMLERPEKESLHRSLIEQASRVGRHSEGQVLSMCGRDFGVSASRANTDASRSSATCYDVMDPDDCRLLFGVCDPVMCPSSRFNLGGAWQVNDVVQTGLIGSIVLGLHNFDIPYEPVPICLTGVLAGLQNIKSVLRGYVECLKTAQVQGISVGICDKIRSVFICEIIWKEAMAIINMKGGIFNWVSETFFDQEQGGGEYLTFESSIQNVEDSVSFFTSEYATTAFASYESRSTEEMGTEICKQAIFGKVPAFGEFFDELAQPESPPQYTAIVDESVYSETQHESIYTTFYHIYAGEDNPATYSVFLKNAITNDVHYVTGRCEGRQGSIEKGGIASFNLDCRAPTGYDQVCITLNGNTECGFGKVSTDFALDYLSDMIVSDESQRQINSEDDCIESAPRTSPSLGSIPLPGRSGLLSSGVQRVCSVQNPGQGTNPIDWREVGTCGKDSTGRSIGRCWIDMRTVSINNADTMKEVSEALDERGFRSLREEMGFDVLEYEDSIIELKNIEKISTDSCEGITNAMSAYKYLEARTITPKIAAEAGYKYAELMDKAARDCAFVDPRREFARILDLFEYDLEGIYFLALDEFENNVAPYMTTSEPPAAFVREYHNLITIMYNNYTTIINEELAKFTPEERAYVGEELFNQFSENMKTLYETAYNMQEPFVFRKEIPEAERSQQVQIDENKCNECTSGYTGVICRKVACHSQGSTCYWVRGRDIAFGTVPTGDYAGTECHTCSKLTSCSELNGETGTNDMCNNQACTDRARNGEGMSCVSRVVDGQTQCLEVERRAQSATVESSSSGPIQGACPQTTTLSCDDSKARVDISKVDMTNNIKTTGNVGTVDFVKNGINKELIPLYKEVAGDRLPWEMLAVMHLREGGAGNTASILNGGSLCNNNDGSRCSACNDGATLKNDLECGARELLQKAGKNKIEASDLETIKTAMMRYGGSNAECPDVSFQVTALFDDYHLNMWKTGIDCVWLNCKEGCVSDATLETGRQPSGCCSIKVYNKGQEPSGFNIAGGQSHCNSNVRSECISETGEQNGGKYTVYSYKSCTMKSTTEPCGTIVKQNRLGVFTIYAILKQLQRTDASFRGGAAGTSTASSTTTSSSSTTTATVSSNEDCISAGGTCKAGCTPRYEEPMSNSCSTGVCCRPKARAGITPNAQTERVGVIGDSITQDGRYVNYLNQQCRAANIDFFEHGGSGEGSTAIARRFDSVILSNNYNDVIIMAGVNNICDGSTTVERDLGVMYKKAKDAGLRVIALTITPWKGTTGTFGWTTTCQRNQETVNSWIKTAPNVDVVVDVYSILNDPANPGAMKTQYHAAGQFLHPNKAGQEAIGKAIQEAAYADVCTAS